MEVGVEGGVVGGVPGGVLGGVIGGTGDGTGARLRPAAPSDQAHASPSIRRKPSSRRSRARSIVEILIDSTGRVIRARVIRSIPLLDAAAIRTVYEWVFSPAMKDGRPVATIASAPVAFRIF